MNTSLLRDFTNPPAQYRGKPFWAWNGKLEPAELRRQIRLMKKMGLGGFFMHSRVGLDTAYLSDDWFDCVGACIDEAKKQNMEAWLYDEDRWPSGAAGGLVTKNPAYRMRHLQIEIVDKVTPGMLGKGCIAAFSAIVDGPKATSVRRLVKGASVAGGSVIIFREKVSEPSDWHNGGTYLDTMNYAAVKEFISETHETYRKKIGRFFGKLVPGIFTDEPNYGDFWDPSDKPTQLFPWTRGLPALFKKRWGYDIIDHLPEIFFDVDGRTVSQARQHYRELVTFLFVDAFARQIGQWCGKNKIAFTGHVLAEETLSSQTSRVGSAMRFYEHMQAPGIDILTQNNREYDTAKGVASVAHQFNKKWRLSETYGCTGWDFPFAGHKAVHDWQTALGINLRCQHLAWYTMEGEAKRDYPAAIFYQSPWWEHYAAVEDYYSRVHAVMGRGEEVRDILVVWPIESMWQLQKVGWNKDSAVKQMDRSIIELRDSLLGANLDFDYGDEDILSRHARVTTAKDGRARVRVGRAEYSVVVVPPMVTMRASTLKQLSAFAAKGGTVVFAGEPARAVDAIESSDIVALAGRCVKAPATGAELAAAAAKGRRVSIVDKSGSQINATLHLLREDKEAQYLFVVNTGHKLQIHNKDWPAGDTHHTERDLAFDSVTIKGFSGCSGAPLELDAQTGSVLAADARASGDGWEIRTSLPRLGSRLFVIPKSKAGKQFPVRPTLTQVSSRPLGGQQWDVLLSEPNVLVLDRPAYTIGKTAEQPAEEILRVDNKVHETLKLRHRGGAMVQPWARKKSVNPKAIPVKLRYSFEVETLPAGSLQLALEQVQRFVVEVNANRIDTATESGWWVDRSLRTLRIDPALLRTGANEIVLTCDYDENHPGLEIVYLLGDFGVKVDATATTITGRNYKLELGDWVGQGLPFYSGSVGYVTTIEGKRTAGERQFVRIPGYQGVAVRVLIDGKAAGTVGWDPHEVDITEFIGDKPATLCVEVLGHRRNSHGPLHLTEKRPGWTGPGQFKTSGKDWTDGYSLVSCGLMAQPELVVRK
jgi:hypothetical protein